jgi:hypothetical protein
LPFVEDLVHGVLVVAVLEVVLGRRALAEMALLAADCQRARIHRMLDVAEASRFEAVVHPDHVQLRGQVRWEVAADVIGEVDQSFGPDLGQDADHVVKLGDIAAQNLDAIAQFIERCCAGVNVHADDPFAARGEQRESSGAQ